MTQERSDLSEEPIKALFAARGVHPVKISIRHFPEETVVLALVAESDLDAAIKISSQIEDALPLGCLLVVRRQDNSVPIRQGRAENVNDPRVTRLVEILNERSRTSEQQPSLLYIKDAAENVRVVVTKRHHIIFGRRGVGKTALLLEAKRQLEGMGSRVLWANIQSLRGLDATSAFLTIIVRLCEMPALSNARLPASSTLAQKIRTRAEELIGVADREREVALLVPDCQRMLNLMCSELGSDVFLILDDFHHLGQHEQPKFLDLLHGATRDTSVWLKIAGIRNQCRVFQSDPPLGMQIGHDAAMISLDVTLEEPKKARAFLGEVLQTYLNAAAITGKSGVLSNGAIDRLVLASAGVPRDFLVLTARSIQIARGRPNVRSVGTQDVNEAAGEAGQQKIADLEEDVASSSAQRIQALDEVRKFTIGDRHCSFFRVGFKDKNEKPEEYAVLQSLMDLRLIHLIKGSLSEAHAAGERSEVYMIDLSEYSGSKLKKDISVIELQGDALVLRKTGQQGEVTIADTPRKLVQIFRTGPQFDLGLLSPLSQRTVGP